MRSGHPPTRHSSLPLKPEMKFFEWELQGLMPIPTAWWKGTFIQKSQNSTWSPGGFTCEYVQMHMNRQKKMPRTNKLPSGKKEHQTSSNRNMWRITGNIDPDQAGFFLPGANLESSKCPTGRRMWECHVCCKWHWVVLQAAEAAVSEVELHQPSSNFALNFHLHMFHMFHTFQVFQLNFNLCVVF